MIRKEESSLGHNRIHTNSHLRHKELVKVFTNLLVNILCTFTYLALGTNESTHVLHNSKNRQVNFAAEIHLLSDILQRHLLHHSCKYICMYTADGIAMGGSSIHVLRQLTWLSRAITLTCGVVTNTAPST